MFCCVVGCPNKSKLPINKRCFPFPKTFYKFERLKETSKRRREAWIRALRIVAPIQEIINQLGVCSNHFIKGCPSKIADEKNPDWVPNKNLGTGDNRICEFALKRKLVYLNNDSNVKETLLISDSESFGGSCDEYDEPNVEFVSVAIPPEIRSILDENKPTTNQTYNELDDEEDYANISVREAANPLLDTRENKQTAKQFAMTIQKLKLEIQNKEQIIEAYEHKQKCLENKCRMVTNSYEFKVKEQDFVIKNLKSKLKNLDMTRECFQNDDAKVRNLTGLHSFSLLNKLYEVVEDQLSEYPKANIDKFHSFVITLMKLRMDLPMSYLSYCMGLSPLIVSKMYRENLSTMNLKIGPLVKWPDDEVLFAKTPSTYKEIMGNKSIIFIHFLKILIKNLRLQNPENMKHTIKYLLAFTSSGEIIFVSQGFGNEYSDENIIEESGFLDKINEETIVLCVKDMFDESQKDNYQIQRVKHMAKSTEDKVLDLLKENFRILFNRQAVNSIGEVYSKYTVKCCCALANLLLPESADIESSAIESLTIETVNVIDANDREILSTMEKEVNGEEI